MFLSSLSHYKEKVKEEKEMDRVELRKFLDEERALAHKWRADAEKSVAEAERLFEDFNDYVLSVGKANLTEEERAQYKEIKQVVHEAHEELIFFDGVKKGIDAVAKQIGERLAMEELANAGKWIPKPFKPKRR